MYLFTYTYENKTTFPSIRECEAAHADSLQDGREECENTEEIRAPTDISAKIYQIVTTLQDALRTSTLLLSFHHSTYMPILYVIRLLILLTVFAFCPVYCS